MRHDDSILFQTLQDKLYTPVVGDVLDSRGLYHQTLPPRIWPLNREMKLVGRAMPVLMADVYGEPDEPFGKLTQALDQLELGEIYIATGGEQRCAYWGEILTATAKSRGALGAVINGYHRDTPKVLAQNWPVFSRGAFAQDSRVRSWVIDYRCPIEIGRVRVHPGDLVIADADGIVVVPAEYEKDVIDLAMKKASSENKVRHEIERNGMSSTEAFRKYGVL